MFTVSVIFIPKLLEIIYGTCYKVRYIVTDFLKLSLCNHVLYENEFFKDDAL